MPTFFSSPAPSAKVKTRLITVADAGQLGFDYTIRLSARKSAAIEVRDGKVLVAAPLRASQAELGRWVADKADWIRDKLSRQAQRQQQVPQRSFHDGEQLPWLGEPLSLHIIPGTRNACERRERLLQVTLSRRSMASPSAATAQILHHWYQQQARLLLEAKTAAVCQQLQQRFPLAQCQRVQLRRTRSKWGHCTRQGVIQYNWLIVQAPEWVVDYLVVHECCHLVHHNHSRAFWGLVASIFPHWGAARDWLRQHGHTLVL